MAAVATDSTRRIWERSMPLRRASQASADHTPPSGRNIPQKTSIRRKLSAPLRIGGTRLWRETRKSHEATLASRVRKPTRTAEAKTAASPKRAAWYDPEPPPKWNDQFQKLV